MQDRFLRALNLEPVDRMPIWFMRQAGRYLPEYRALRAKATSFEALVQNAQLAAEVSLLPINRYPDLDAIIIFSDILVLADAMGLGLYMQEGLGPCMQRPIRTEADIKRLAIIDPSAMSYTLDAISLVKKLNQKPLIGFAACPWSLACYMVDGGFNKDFILTKTMLYSAPLSLHALLEKVSINTLNYLLAQIASGADVIMLFDTWAGILRDTDYLHFSYPYIEFIIRGIKDIYPKIPIIWFSKDAGRGIDLQLSTAVDAIGLDWLCPLSCIEKIKHKAVQGNLEPALLYAGEEKIAFELDKLLKSFSARPGAILNLGHGILPNTDPKKLDFLIQTAITRTKTCL